MENACHTSKRMLVQSGPSTHIKSQGGSVHLPQCQGRKDRRIPGDGWPDRPTESVRDPVSLKEGEEQL